MLKSLRSVALTLSLALGVVGFAGPAPASIRTASAAPAAACSASGTHILSKTRFLLHAGIGFGAFHRYIYKPLKTGGFSAGSRGRTKAFLKAAGSVALIIHELKQAKKFAESDPTLCKLAAPLDDLNTKITGLGSKLKDGSASTADLDSANNAISQISSQSASTGATINEK